MPVGLVACHKSNLICNNNASHEPTTKNKWNATGNLFEWNFDFFLKILLKHNSENKNITIVTIRGQLDN